MDWLNALLGRIFSRGTELELRGGLDFLAPFTVAANVTANRNEVTIDTEAAAQESYKWSGNSTYVESGAGTSYLRLDESSFSLACADVVASGSVVVVGVEVVLTKSDGTAANIDDLAFGLYRESASSETHLLQLDASGSDVTGTGAQSITLTGANSGLDYTVGVSAYAGDLTVQVEQDATTRNVRARVWRRASTEVPTS